MSNGTALIARRSVRARLGRLIAIAVAILLGVSFVVGSFVLADTLRATFDKMFSNITEHVDLEVRSSVAFDQTAADQRDPLPATLVEQVAGVDGVGAIEASVFRYAQVLDEDGKAVSAGGAPTYGTSWAGDAGLGSIDIRGEGRPPEGPTEMALDKSTAERVGLEVGDQVQVLTDTGTHEFTLTALIGQGGTDGFTGASMAAWDLPTAQSVLGAEGQVDTIDIALADGADGTSVQEAIQALLPPRTEVVTGDELRQEASDTANMFIGPFGTGLLIFAFITAFVSAFLISNVFNITIGQRLRELALLRAVGAGGQQVRRMILLEALVVSLIATVIGIAGGLLVARGILAVFNAAGVSFPSTGLVLRPTAILMAFLVGVGITLLAVAIPAWRAARIPPVAAMHPELGFDAISPKRFILGTIVTVVGAAMFVVGLFARPGGAIGTIALCGLGGLLLFLGVSSLSATVARPVTRLLGWPVAKAFGPAGMLARDNAGRAPRRTSASASALMIGVALVSAASVFAASLRDTFNSILERGVTADVIVSSGGQNGQGLPPAVAEALAALPEVGAVTPVRGASAQIDGSTTFLAAVDPASTPELINVDMQSGGFEGLDPNGILVYESKAEDLGLAVGDTLPVTFQNGTVLDLTVAGIYGDDSLAGQWVISLDTLSEASSSPESDFFVPLKLAPGTDVNTGRQAIDRAMEAFPQAQVQSNAEYRAQVAGQVDQLLVVISALLGLSIVIAVLGISITMALGVFERTREIGLLRAVGMTKRQTRRAVRWEAVIVSLFGAVVGLVVGTLIGIALCYAVPNEVVDRVSLSPVTIVIILVGAVLAGLIAALFPSYKASNLDVLDAIAAE